MAKTTPVAPIKRLTGQAGAHELILEAFRKYQATDPAYLDLARDRLALKQTRDQLQATQAEADQLRTAMLSSVDTAKVQRLTILDGTAAALQRLIPTQEAKIDSHRVAVKNSWQAAFRAARNPALAEARLQHQEMHAKVEAEVAKLYAPLHELGAFVTYLSDGPDRINGKPTASGQFGTLEAAERNAG